MNVDIIIIIFYYFFIYLFFLYIYKKYIRVFFFVLCVPYIARGMGKKGKIKEVLDN
jgi:Ca2+/Na+ antiporter